jgi:hypothetical protein
MNFEIEETEACADLIASTDPGVKAGDAFTELAVRDAMLGMWQDARVQRTMAKGREYALKDNLSFYFERELKEYSTRHGFPTTKIYFMLG